MRRLSVAFPLLLALLLGLAAGGLAPARAQDNATPTAEDEDFLPEGVSLEFLAVGTATDLPGVGELVLFRLRFEPGSAFPLTPDDAGTALVLAEEGELTIEIDAAVTVVRAPEEGQFPTEFEEVAAGEAFTLAVGDSTVVPGRVTGEVRNDGDEEAVLLISNIDPAQGEAGATPTADTSVTAVEFKDFSFRSDTVVL